MVSVDSFLVYNLGQLVGGVRDFYFHSLDVEERSFVGVREEVPVLLVLLDDFAGEVMEVMETGQNQLDDVEEDQLVSFNSFIRRLPLLLEVSDARLSAAVVLHAGANVVDGVQLFVVHYQAEVEHQGGVALLVNFVVGFVVFRVDFVVQNSHTVNTK